MAKVLKPKIMRVVRNRLRLFAQGFFRRGREGAVYVEGKIRYDIQIIPEFVVVILPVFHVRVDLAHQFNENVGVASTLLPILDVDHVAN